MGYYIKIINWETSMYTDISELVGKTLWKIDVSSDSLRFYTTEAEEYLMYHDQDCCEHVYIEDMVGDHKDLLNSPIVLAEERSSDEPAMNSYDEAYLWTFYELATVKGSVTIRWYGSSNGYYSVSVSFRKM
jgi:outer membrane protein assembly factor BamB